MKVTVLIPARMEATRFPGKPLYKIGDKPMIQWVYERASQSQAQQVIVATDSEEIHKTVKAFGGHVEMTSPKHRNGTQRIAEIAARLDAEIIVNVQGDEPTIHPQAIDQVIQPLQNDGLLEMATLAEPIVDHDSIFNPNIVKVVRDKKGRAMFFSRAPIPFFKHPNMDRIYWEPNGEKRHLRHIGIYGYQRRFLLDYVAEPLSELEHIEGLEQLRALYMGAHIQVELTSFTSIGVDTPEDAKKAEQFLSEEG